MGNLAFIIPTENKEKFNVKDIEKLLKEKFPQYTYVVDKNFIGITREDGSTVTELYFKYKCYVVHYDEDIAELKEKAEEYKNHPKYPELYDRYIKMSEELAQLKELNPNLKNSIALTYGTRNPGDIWWVEKDDIWFFLHNTFKAYMFDEGIHPEFMSPTYIRSKHKPKLTPWYNYLLYPIIFVVFLGYVAVDSIKNRYRRYKTFGK